MNIRWTEKRTNISIFDELNITRELLRKVVSLNVGYFGHVACGSGSPLAVQMLEGKVEGKREADKRGVV